jgi:hypothetical protein
VLGHPALQAAEEVLAVALDQELDVAALRRVDEDVREVRLDAGVKVDLGLLEDHGGPRFREIALHENRQELRDAEADVRDQDLGRFGRSLDPDLVVLSVLRDPLDPEGVDDPHSFSHLAITVSNASYLRPCFSPLGIVLFSARAERSAAIASRPRVPTLPGFSPDQR